MVNLAGPSSLAVVMAIQVCRAAPQTSLVRPEPLVATEVVVEVETARVAEVEGIAVVIADFLLLMARVKARVGVPLMPVQIKYALRV